MSFFRYRLQPAHVSNYGDGYSLLPRIEMLPDFVPLKEGESREKLV